MLLTGHDQLVKHKEIRATIHRDVCPHHDTGNRMSIFLQINFVTVNTANLTPYWLRLKLDDRLNLFSSEKSMVEKSSSVQFRSPQNQRKLTLR